MKKTIKVKPTDLPLYINNIKQIFELNESFKNLPNSTRGINIHSDLTEGLVASVFPHIELIRGSFGDGINTLNNKIVEIKATSNYNADCSSFSPTETFDELGFVRIDYPNKIIDIYNLNHNSEQMGRHMVNKTTTFRETQLKGIRPRLSLIKSIIEPNNLQPIARINMEDCSVNYNIGDNEI